MDLHGKTLVVVITGGIAAYKSLDLIGRLRERGARVIGILTRDGEKFVTPLSVSALCDEPARRSLFKDPMEHIELGRRCDGIIVAPATAQFLARIAHGFAGDLASALILGSWAPVLLAPSMNTRMWKAAATQRNLKLLAQDGFHILPPDDGALACGEVGTGRLPSAARLLDAIEALFPRSSLCDIRALVTSGPTREAVDPVRYLTNHSSGKQGHAIAKALAHLGAQTTLISGPTTLPDPRGVELHRVESAEEMLRVCEKSLPVDVAVCVAAVADWHPRRSEQKHPKDKQILTLTPTPDILAHLSQNPRRPRLVIGFAAQSGPPQKAGHTKRHQKKCDWVLANDLFPAEIPEGILGSDRTQVHLISKDGCESWPVMSKTALATRLAQRITTHLKAQGKTQGKTQAGQHPS